MAGRVPRLAPPARPPAPPPPYPTWRAGARPPVPTQFACAPSNKRAGLEKQNKVAAAVANRNLNKLDDTTFFRLSNNRPITAPETASLPPVPFRYAKEKMVAAPAAAGAPPRPPAKPLALLPLPPPLPPWAEILVLTSEGRGWEEVPLPLPPSPPPSTEAVEEAAGPAPAAIERCPSTARRSPLILLSRSSEASAGPSRRTPMFSSISLI